MTTQLIAGTLPVRWVLDGMLLAGYDTFGCRWITQRSTGWRDGAPPRTRREARQAGSGSSRAPALLDERIVTLTGTCRAPSAAARAAAQRRLGAVLPILGELVVTEEDGVTLRAHVEHDDAPTTTPKARGWFDWSLQLAAPDPRRYTGWDVAGPVPLLSGSSGGINATAPGISATAPGISAGIPGLPGQVAVTNRGTEPVGPVLQITGPLDPNLQVIVAESTTLLALSGALDAGTSLWINCDDQDVYGTPVGTLPGHAVLLDGVASRRRQLAISGGWPLLPPGLTRRFLLAGTGSGSLTVHSRSAWR